MTVDYERPNIPIALWIWRASNGADPPPMPTDPRSRPGLDHGTAEPQYRRPSRMFLDQQFPDFPDSWPIG